jgi:hypothetical protein
MLVRQANNWILESVKFASYMSIAVVALLLGRSVRFKMAGSCVIVWVRPLLNCYVYHG